MQDILAGKFQIIISSIEAFTDTTRLLPIVKSPELAALGPQCFIIDEAHCIPKWGQHFRPQYAIVGTLRLLLTREVPMVAATATANNLMRQAIKQSLRFGSNAFEVNLGNRRPNIAYSVHRLPNVSAVVAALLEYFHSKSELPGFTLIFVDSRKLGAQLLEALRQHVDPEIRGDIQLYHASRSEFDKKILAAGFERDDGFKAMFTTEALTMGLDYRRLTRVIQVLAPTDPETLVQRMGRCGRDKTVIGHAILLAQDSLFEDSKSGQKRLQKNIKKEESAPADKKSGKSTKESTGNDKARRVPREYSQHIVDFINTTGCRVAILDKAFDNPPRPPEEICLCDNCTRDRGDKTLRDLMAETRSVEVAVEPEDEEKTPEDEEDEPQEETEDETAPVDINKKRKYRPKNQRGEYIEALNKWRDEKFRSPECRWWDITREWILPERLINSIAMHPGMVNAEELNKLKPGWVHYDRWGAEVYEVISKIELRKKEEREKAEEERRAKVERLRAAREEREAETRRRAEEKRQKEAAIETQSRELDWDIGNGHMEPSPLTDGPQVASSSSSEPPPRKRNVIPKDATEEEKAALRRKRKQESNKLYYQRKKSKQVKQEESTKWMRYKTLLGLGLQHIFQIHHPKSHPQHLPGSHFRLKASFSSKLWMIFILRV
ncbi:hypothetical protein FRC11_014560 [Ceratobasidium sp. 423]|nr:hypothetical protein FRC11_014560 [Ceratobasidium sp. 423]